MDISVEKVLDMYKGHKPEPIGTHRYFSVLVPFVEKDGNLNLLYETRSKDVSQPGEVCFPGGHMEKGESPTECALRETYEEIGIHCSNLSVAGKGDIIYGYANYTLFTTIGIIPYEQYKNARLQKDEVDEIFLVSVDKLSRMQPEIHKEEIFSHVNENFPYKKVGIDTDYPWRVGDWEIPIYEVDGKVIWGLTARITKGVVDFLYNK